MLDQCEESYLLLERPELRPEELGKIFRIAHSIKGAGAAVGYADLATFAHGVEDCLAILRVKPELVDDEVISLLLRTGDAFKTRVKMLKAKSSETWDVKTLAQEVAALNHKLSGTNLPPTQGGETPPGPPLPAALPEHAPSKPHAQVTSVKVDIERIEAVLNMVGELVVLNSQLVNETRADQSNPKLNALISLMEKSIRGLQDESLGMRMTPLKSLFLRTQRVVRDLAVTLGKPVEFEMSGEETEIDRTMVELLGDPLMHIIRNALDHGIEKPELRTAAGKPAKGCIHLRAQQVGSRVLVRISDDGAGIYKEKIFKKALEKGLIPAGRDMSSVSQQEIYQFIFAPGFSTAEKVTAVSGRGVGMDVVKTNIEKLRGSIEIKTEPGKGTEFLISIPVTTSITDGMRIESAGNPYILPLNVIRELVNYKPDMAIRRHDGRELLNVRGRILPMVDLSTLLGMNVGDPDEAARERYGTIVVVDSTKGPMAIRVDSVEGQVQVVLKSLGDYLIQSAAGGAIAGAAILGDGKVALVLDVDSLETGGSAAA